MLSFASLAFANPWVLLGLLALPGLWFLVRALPPRPKRVTFPPIRLLRRLERSEPPPARTPLWLLLLRFALAALLLIALAGPVLNPSDRLAGEGPLLIVLDDGWQAADRWSARTALLDRLLAKAAREDRPAILLTTAPPAGGFDEEERARLPEPQPAETLRRRLAGLVPKPFSPDHATAAGRLEASARGIGSALWISDGLAHSGSSALEDALAAAGLLRVYADPQRSGPYALLPLEQSGLNFLARVRRPAGGPEAALTLQAVGADGRRLASAPAVFEVGAETAQARLALPQRLRNQVARIEIGGMRSAGAVNLLDARAGRLLVGLAEGARGPQVEPLRSPAYYLERALEPHAELETGSPENVLESKPQAIVLADIGDIAESTRRQLGDWMDSGGVLIRFAGPQTAEGDTALLPVRLRSGERAVGGALSWEEPQKLGGFSESGPLAGLTVPDDVTVRRQLLAVPSPELSRKTWARLEDGTPLVTAERRGRGWLVFVHTTAGPAWSDLAFSGLYVAMLQRLLSLAQMAPEALMQGDGPASLAPQRLMDGFGDLTPVRRDIAPIPAARLDSLAASPEHPPGLYGPAEAPLALDLAGPNGPIDGDFRFTPAERETAAIETGARAERDLRPQLLLIVAVLILADLIAGLAMRGLLRLPRLRWGAAAGVFAAALMLVPSLGGPASAQEGQALDDSFAVAATTGTRIAYIETGDPAIDRMTQAGLRGLARIVDLRTAITLDEAMPVDPDSQPLSLFPLVYWPVSADAEPLSAAAQDNLRDFLRTGGIVLFDTGVNDAAGESMGLQNPAAREALRRLLGGLNLPGLVPVDEDHVLGRSFYLLDRFPGRIRGRDLWVARESAGEEATVSPVVIGGHDWAAAWAIGETGEYRVPDLSGGAVQREMAYRFGVNLVMYALTGTYKADQLHMPALIERLGE